jgi:hypothetical protein
MADVAYELPFRAGFDESIREEVLEPSAAFTTLQNGRYDKVGGYTKRRGYTALGTTRLDGTSRSAGYRLLTNASQLCTINGTELDSVGVGADNSWSPKGRVPEATYRHLEVPSIGLGVETNVNDVVVCGDVSAVIYSFANIVAGIVDLYTIVTVFDVATGAVIRDPEAINIASINGSALTPYLATYGAYIIAITADFTTDDITASYLDTTSRSTINAGWTLIGTIASDLGTSHICVASQSDRVAVAYGNDSGGASQLTVKTLNISGVIETVNINTSSLAPGGPSLSEGGATLWVAWAEEVAGGPPTVTNFKVLGLDPSNIDGTAVATVATVISTSRAGGEGAGVTWLVSTGATTGVLYAINENVFDCDGINVRAFTTSAGATTPSGSTSKRGNSVPAGRPFYRGSRVYMPVTSSILEEIVLCDVTPPDDELTWRPVAVPVNRGSFVLNTSNPRARCAVSGDNTYLSVFMVVKAGTANSLSSVFGCALVEYDFANPYRWKPATLNGSTFLSGGVESIYDGRHVFEAGFLCRPPPVEVDTSSAGSQTFTLGGRSYVATYEELDADGNWHVSGVSDSVSAGNITTQTVLISVQPLSITARDVDVDMPLGAGVRLGIWVTTDGGEPPYYRLATIENDPTSETVTIEDDYAEADFTSSALLYATGNLPTTGGSSQDHRAPPGLLYHVAYNGMLVGASGKTIYFSSQPIDGEGTWFSPAFSVGGSIDDDVTGMTVQDGSIVIFTRRGVWITAGEPPADNGSSGGLSTPRKLAIDLGCVNANSILTTGMGTFFQSDRGLELLSRGHTITPIDKFQDQLDTYPVITSAVLDTRNGLAIFSLAESQTDGLASTNGKDVVLDLTRGVWSSIDDKRGGVATQATQDACMAYIDGAWRYTWLGTTGVVYYERDSDDASAHLDGSTWVTQRAITPWLHIAGIQGEQFVDQVLALCKFHTAHDLTISLAFDYSDSFTSTKTFTAAQIGALARQWLVKETGDHTTSQAVRVKVEDATPSTGSVGTGKGSTWVALTFSGHPHAKVKRTTSAQRGG